MMALGGEAPLRQPAQVYDGRFMLDAWIIPLSVAALLMLPLLRNTFLEHMEAEQQVSASPLNCLA